MTRPRTILLICCTICIMNAAVATAACKGIRKVPYKIMKPGSYCLKRNLTFKDKGTDGAAISINGDNVTLNFSGYKICTNGFNEQTEAIGVSAEDYDNISIRNGMTCGFHTGVRLSGGTGHVIEDMQIDLSYTRAIAVINAESVIVRKNRITRTGGNGLNVSAYGILVYEGSEARVIDNDVSNTSRNLSDSQRAYGISITGDTSIAENNRVTNSTDYGIYFSNNTDVFAFNNRILNSTDGVIGLRFNTTPSLYKDNMIGGFTTPVRSGTDGGGNAILP